MSTKNILIHYRMRLRMWWHFLVKAPRQCLPQSSSPSLFVSLKPTGWVSMSASTSPSGCQGVKLLPFEGQWVSKQFAARGRIICSQCFVEISWQKRRMNRGGVRSRCYLKKWSKRSSRKKTPRWDSHLWLFIVAALVPRSSEIHLRVMGSAIIPHNQGS